MARRTERRWGIGDLVTIDKGDGAIVDKVPAGYEVKVPRGGSWLRKADEIKARKRALMKKEPA